HKLDSKELKVQHKTRTSFCVGGDAIMLSMITQTIEAKDGITHQNSIYLLEELRMFMIFKTHLYESS
ncbi:hypothetical protein B7L07_039640, partial [Burkholderia cenocepacia]|nr:hypothetical protein [Burkholderia cenocepacia]